jgi:hypothetical protein
MKILLDFNAKEGREDIFKLAIGSESLHEINNDNMATVVTVATSKNLSRVQCSHIATFTNTLGLLMVGRRTVS